MADSNYEEYQQFVTKHISEGFEKIKEEDMEKIVKKKILPKAGILLKFKGNLKELQIKGEIYDEKLDFVKKLLKNGEKNEEKPRNLEKIVKFYLNLCYSDQ